MNPAVYIATLLPLVLALFSVWIGGRAYEARERQEEEQS